MGDAALIQVDLEGGTGDMIACRQLDFLDHVVVADQ
jgi:hypothetical protein